MKLDTEDTLPCIILVKARVCGFLASTQRILYLIHCRAAKEAICCAGARISPQGSFQPSRHSIALTQVQATQSESLELVLDLKGKAQAQNGL